MKTPDLQIPKFQITEFRKKSTKYCICIPVLNEGDKILNQLKRMLPYCKMADLIIADWGSTDGSTDEKVLKKLNIRTLLTLKSPGRQSTQLRMAYAYALKQGYKGIITIDGNGKDGVEKIPEFIKALEEGYDCIQGSRFAPGGKAINTPLLRYVGIRLIFSPILSLASNFWFTDITNGFRAYSSKFLLDKRVQPFRSIFVRYELLFYLPIRAAQLRLKVRQLAVKRGYPKDNIPTKITGINSHLDLLSTAFKVAFNLYSPSTKNYP